MSISNIMRGFYSLVLGLSFLVPLNGLAMPGLAESDKVVKQKPALEQNKKRLASDKSQAAMKASKSRSANALDLRAPKFTRLDKNADGKMSLVEFQKTFPEDRANVSLKQAFDHLDEDKSGNISEKEYNNFVAHVKSIQKAMKWVH